mgnify:CR=1 FL=1
MLIAKVTQNGWEGSLQNGENGDSEEELQRL